MPGKETAFKRECGVRLRQARLALGYASAREFAKLTGVSEDNLSTWERGVALVPPPYLLDLYRRYKIPFEWIYAGEVGQLPVHVYQAIKGESKSAFRPVVVK
jgi:transcriptional regulator with XRE-family HTH domain